MITLKQEPIFTLCLNGKTYPGFRITSEWEGLKKLEGNGQVLVVATTKAGGPFADIFHGVFGNFMACGQDAEYQPLMASAGLRHLFVETGQEQSAAARDVLAERQRQISVEGWTPEHDDGHKNGDLAIAGACYASNAATWLQRGSDALREDYRSLSPGARWPWLIEWWKPTNERRDLVKAGALILAEIERLDRAAAAAKGAQALEGKP